MDFDDPAELADLVASRPRPLLLALDVDGVLAPLVDHPDDSRLLDGVTPPLIRLAVAADIDVAVVSGRSLAGLEQFGFDSRITVVGSHGMETRGAELTGLDGDERARLAQLQRLADDAVAEAGNGAMVEHKPAGVVVHIRRADPTVAVPALERLRAAAEEIPGTTITPGSNVLELLARHSDKGGAVTALAELSAAATTVFVGDDVTDEHAFARLGDGDVAIKVGTAETVAPHRLVDPGAVLSWLGSLAENVAAPSA